MTNSRQKKQNKGTAGVNHVVAAVTGAVVGAGIGVAGAVLSDEKNRKKIGAVLASAKDEAVDFVQKMQAQAEVKKDKVEEIASSAKKSLPRS